MNDTQKEFEAILPDGSAFFTASMPLPKDHWIYAPSCVEWDNDRDESADTPLPFLSNNYRDRVKDAVKWAIRGATYNGKDMDFDPDALVLNVAYAICGALALKTNQETNLTTRE